MIGLNNPFRRLIEKTKSCLHAAAALKAFWFRFEAFCWHELGFFCGPKTRFVRHPASFPTRSLKAIVTTTLTEQSERVNFVFHLWLFSCRLRCICINRFEKSSSQPLFSAKHAQDWDLKCFCPKTFPLKSQGWPVTPKRKSQPFPHTHTHTRWQSNIGQHFPEPWMTSIRTSFTILGSSGATSTGDLRLDFQRQATLPNCKKDTQSIGDNGWNSSANGGGWFRIPTWWKSIQATKNGSNINAGLQCESITLASSLLNLSTFWLWNLKVGSVFSDWEPSIPSQQERLKVSDHSEPQKKLCLFISVFFLYFGVFHRDSATNTMMPARNAGRQSDSMLSIVSGQGFLHQIIIWSKKTMFCWSHKRQWD